MKKAAPYTLDIKDFLDKDGSSVEADVRAALKAYFKSMGLSENSNVKIKKSELRQVIKDITENKNLSELHSFDEFLEIKLTDTKYKEMAKQIFMNWTEKGPDVNWLNVVKIYANNHSKNLTTEINVEKLYEYVLDLAEEHAQKAIYVKYEV